MHTPFLPIPSSDPSLHDSPLLLIANLIDGLHSVGYSDNKVILAENLSKRLHNVSLSDIINARPDALEIIAISANTGFTSPLEAVTPSLNSLPSSTLIALSADTLYQIALSASLSNRLYRNQYALDNIAVSLKNLTPHELIQILINSPPLTFSTIIDAAMSGSTNAFFTIYEALFTSPSYEYLHTPHNEEHENILERIKKHLYSRDADIQKILTDGHQISASISPPPSADLSSSAPTIPYGVDCPFFAMDMDAENFSQPTPPSIPATEHNSPASCHPISASLLLPKARRSPKSDQASSLPWLPYEGNNLADHSRESASPSNIQVIERCKNPAHSWPTSTGSNLTDHRTEPSPQATTVLREEEEDLFPLDDLGYS